MNFLAHFHLAWPDPALVAGGLEGDYFKGPLKGEQPLENGIKLHRAIDAFTDQHPVIQQLRSQLAPRLRRYAGILVDLSFDHYLSHHWSTYSDISLADFNQEVYASLLDHQHMLSIPARAMATRLIEYDVLGLYGEWATVPATAERIGQRFKRGNPFIDINSELSSSKDQLEEAFLTFYPDLLEFGHQHTQQRR